MQRQSAINCALFMMLILVSSAVSARHFEAPLHEARWKLTRTKMVCRLQQDIPFYGRAVFTNHAIYGHGFYLKTKRTLVKNQQAYVRSIPADWKHGEPVKEISDIQMKKGKIPLKFARNLSITLLAELEQGRFPTFYFVDAPGPEDQVTVALSAVRFLPAFEKFKACGRKLARFKFKYIRNRRVYFATAKHNISPAYARKLDEIAAFILKNQSVSFIRIDGHTDIIGGFGYNLKLSAKRAQAVKRYLMQRNVPASMIKTRHFGKIRPAASNRTASGRRKNRRAYIRLYRK